MPVIAVPLNRHAPLALEALEAGKHVLTEKLMAHDVSQCKQMIKKAREKNLLLAVGHQRHYSVLYDNANHIVSGGTLGDVKFMAAIGAFLGWPLTLLTLLMASLSGSIVGLFLILTRRGGMKSALPFGTFLALGAVIAATVGPRLVHWYLGLL